MTMKEIETRIEELRVLLKEAREEHNFKKAVDLLNEERELLKQWSHLFLAQCEEENKTLASLF